VLRRTALPHLRRSVRHARLGDMAVAFAVAEGVLAEGGVVAHRNAHGLDPSEARVPNADRERAKLRAWGGLLAADARERGPVRGSARLAGLGAGGIALGIWRGARRSRHAPLSRRDMSAAVLDGCAAAFGRGS
jgi:hypothetical protein